MEDSMEIPQKPQNKSIIWANSLLESYTNKIKSAYDRVVCTPMFIYSSIYNSLDIESTQMSDNWCQITDNWMKKMWYIYTMDYYTAIKKNELHLLQQNEYNWRQLCLVK